MKEFLKNNVPDYIRNIKPYKPGKPLEELERELGIKRSVKMASNENPLGPSPKAIAAIQKAVEKISFYPEGGSFYLKQKLIKKLGIKSTELVLGNGSNEMIELLLRCFIKPGDNIVISEYAFLMYKISAMGMGADVLTARAKNLGHDLDAMASMVNKKTRLIFIANPNNPTGSYVNKRQLSIFLSSIKSIPVIMDEAYFEYVNARDYPDTIELRKKFPNIITLRTFSKGYGLAGQRIGYAVGNEEIIDYMNRIRQPFNVNLLAQAGALAALGDSAHLKSTITLNQQGKKQLFELLTENDFEYYPSEANFILIKVGKGKYVFNELLKKGIVVRAMDEYGLPAYIRVTISKKEDNKRFFECLLNLVKKGKSNGKKS